MSFLKKFPRKFWSE